MQSASCAFATGGGLVRQPCAPSTSSRSAGQGVTTCVATPSRPPASNKAKRSKVEIIKEGSDFLRHPLMQVRPAATGWPPGAGGCMHRRRQAAPPPACPPHCSAAPRDSVPPAALPAPPCRSW